MNILLALHGIRPEFTGGCEIYVEQLARSLIQEGHSCSILAGSRERGSRPGIEEDELDGVPIFRLRRPEKFVDSWLEAYSPFAESAIGELLDRLSIDLVHLHHWKRLTVNLVQLCAARGIPTVITLHDLWTTCPREYRLIDGDFCLETAGSSVCPGCAERIWWQSEEEMKQGIDLIMAILRDELRTATRRLVPSASHKAMITRAFQLDPSTIDVLPIAVSATRMDRPGSDPLKTSGFPDGPLHLAYWGHLVEFKGPHLLLEALSWVKNLDRVRVHLFGEAVSRQYGLLLDRKSKNKPVEFHGRYEPPDLGNVPIDVGVIPTLCHESYSIVLDEAHQLGIPVLASNRGALAERIGDGGLLFEPGNARELAERIDELIENPERLEELRSRIPKATHTISDHIAALAKIYREDSKKEPVLPEQAPYLSLLEQRGRVLEARQATIEDLHEKAARTRDLEGNLERYRELNREQDKDRRNLRKIIAELERDLRGHVAVLKERDREVAQLREVADTVRSDLEGHQAVLKARSDENQQLHVMVEDLKRDLEGHRAVLQEVTKDLEGHRAVVAELREGRDRLLNEAQKLGAEPRLTTGESEDLESRLEASQAECQQMIQRISELQGARQEDLRMLGIRARKIALLEREFEGMSQSFLFRLARALSRGNRSVDHRD